MDLNTAQIKGRLTKEPTLNNTTNGTPVCNLRIAVNGRKNQNGQQSVQYVPVSIWGKQATTCHAHLVKGQEVTIDGSVAFRSQTIGDQNITVGEVKARVVHFGAKPRGAKMAA